MRRFLHHPLPERGEITLDAAASHHLLQVARIPRGTEVGLFDGRGREARAEVLGTVDGLARVRLLSPPSACRPDREVHLVLAVLKGDAMAHALRMATEAGATHMWPARSARTVPRGDRAERWQRIVASAAQQCGRADVPEVAPLDTLAAQLDRVPASAERFVAAPGASAATASSNVVAVAVGPEGGWTDDELQRFHRADWSTLGLGRWVLRADTAVAIAVAHLA